MDDVLAIPEPPPAAVPAPGRQRSMKRAVSAAGRGAVPDEQAEEERLMLAYAGGDLAAFDELFRRLQPRLHAFLLRMCRDRALADDLLQRTFLKIHHARLEYRSEGRLRAWAYAIAGRVGLDELRRRKRSLEDLDEAELERADATASVQERLRNPAEEAEIVAAVRAAVDALPESQRMVLQLHRFEGLSFAEIGRALGTSEGAIKLRAFRAYERLRSTLAPLVDKECS